MKSTATAVWEGGLKDGKGRLNAGSGSFTDSPYTFAKRFEGTGGGTTPEELVAAAHATCYAMVVTGALGRATGVTWSNLSVKCTITADKGDAGIKLTNSKLEVTAGGLKGMDAAAFEKMAKEAEGKCPISNALRGNLAIDVVAKA